MSICSEAYWFYYNNESIGSNAENQADPTETIVEWVVEMQMGQQDIFTYDHKNIDSKNTAKAIVFHIDLENLNYSISILNPNEEFSFPNFLSKIISHSLKIPSPPPDKIG